MRRGVEFLNWILFNIGFWLYHVQHVDSRNGIVCGYFVCGFCVWEAKKYSYSLAPVHTLFRSKNGTK